MLSLLVASLISTQANTPERPRDIWVFRSVLDKHARMMTVALDKNLWIAYDATYCGLYKAWTGDVKFDGAVYTTVHGPQPTAQGLPYIHNDPDTTTWTFVPTNGKAVPLKPTFKGYTVKNNKVAIKYEIPMANGRKATVIEHPEYDGSREGTVGFERVFEVSGLTGGSLAINVRNQGLKRGLGVKTDSVFKTLGTDNEWTNSQFIINKNGESRLTMYFEPLKMAVANTTPLPAPKPVQQQDESKEREPGLALRLYNIGESMAQLPKLVPGQTANVNTVIPTVNLSGADAFFGLTDQFYLEITGYVKIPVAGKYTFKLASDDGSEMSFDGKVAISHDGLHSAYPPDGEKTVTLDLDAKEYPILVRMFENAGDEAVILSWKKPGDSDFEIVPTSVLSTPKGEVRVTAPGKKRIYGQIPTRQGDRRPLESVHPSYKLSTVRPENFHPRVGGITFRRDGTMVVCTWDPDGAVYEITNYKGDQKDIKVKRIAAGLAEPLGLLTVGNDLFVLQKQELTQLIDNDGDGQIDEFKCIANGWGVTSNFHEFAFGLVYSKGKFYANLATAINPGGSSTKPQNPDRGRTIEISKDGTYRFIAAGLRTPNGIGFGAGGRIFVSDNQGDWLPSSKILLLQEGAFWGNRSVDPVGTKDIKDTPPVVWLPQNEIGNSPSQIAALDHGVYRGQMVHGDVTHGGLKRVFVEYVNGVAQGCVFRFTQGLEAGINRVVVGPDKAFYVGGIGSSGNWGQTGKASYGLQRLEFTGKSTFEMLAVRAKANGMEIEFTEPLGESSGYLPTDYAVQQWRYVPTEEYGGPKIDEETLTIKSVTLSDDRTKAFLEVPGLKAGHVVYVLLHPTVANGNGQAAWTTEGWYTLNELPKAKGKVAPARTTQITPAREAGFRPLLENGDLFKFRGYKDEQIPAGWSAEGDTLAYTPGKGGGDIMTESTYADFDLRFQWQVSEGGNSGVMYRVSNNHNYPWETGAEFQVLDNVRHADGANPFTSAASCYALFEPAFDATRPVGMWNDARIVARGTKIEHYLNGILVTSYDTASDEWARRMSESKFKDMPDFAKNREGYIVFQDHGDLVRFRAIRIRRL
ncbi:MAG: DUF1080 domain-containing protein [Armatimonadetes bacterium]|nr:DUF1080 domain-containing protein [Armatimonadota bacterium]